MPELPEIETLRRGLERETVGRRVKSVDVPAAKAVHRNGVLEVVVPNAGQIATAKKIPVQLEESEPEQQTIEAASQEAPAAGESAA